MVLIISVFVCVIGSTQVKQGTINEFKYANAEYMSVDEQSCCAFKEEPEGFEVEAETYRVSCSTVVAG